MDPNNQNQQPPVVFDNLSKLRLLPAATLEASEKLRDECVDFTSKIATFQTAVGEFHDLLKQRAAQVEAEKLKAIGRRKRLESELELRKRKKQQLMSLVREGQSELERLVAQTESLHKVLQEQQQMIDELSSK
ncbi:hypothetical protein SeMB42_g01896 [Synchytrium endobioticum]|uniref:Intraflagellar transport protein 20 n=1 Tax=Synchytrium endobioticum TaxID=286115 RepID=A0A507CR43_9FUNG|nr:hypothetical protein SeLEV6574_g06001 [Synchytrium endobioticum]TPX51512.1 hypothetical protein SeMB42_g01896 [Synchytrium endobioticum]